MWWLPRYEHFSSPLPIFQRPLPTVSHLGPGSIHPDGGFIFVFVCLLIHASSYSGHRRGFRSTTECKSPRRLIHFHLSLVDIQLLFTFPLASRCQDISLSFSVQDQAHSDQVSPTPTHVPTSCMSNTIHLSPPIFKTFRPLSTFSIPPPSQPWRHTGAHSKRKVASTLPFPLEWKVVEAFQIELGRTWVGLLIKLLQ